MKSLVLCLLVYLFPLYTGELSLSLYGEWELVKDEDGIEVYVRHTPGMDIKSIRIHFEVKASMEIIYETLSDLNGYTEWVYRCTTSKNVKIIDKNHLYYYTVMDFPFPFDDRDAIVYTEHFWDKNNNTYKSKSVVDTTLHYRSEDMVRMTFFNSEWNISPLGENHYKIDYYNQSDPAGAIPDWMVNLAITRGPFETMKKFKEIVEKQ